MLNGVYEQDFGWLLGKKVVNWLVEVVGLETELVPDKMAAEALTELAVQELPQPAANSS